MTPDLHWTVTVDPLTLAIGFAHVQVEHTLGPHASVYLGPSVKCFDGILEGANGPYVGVGAEAGVRGFFWGKAPSGGWIMVRGVLASLSTEVPNSATNLGGYTSALIGFTGIVGPGLVLSGGLGVSYFDYGVLDYGVHGLAPAAHTNVGWAF